MKNIFFLLLSLSSFFATNAQRNSEDEEKKVGFKVNNVFVGGTIVLGYGSAGSFGGSNLVVGANPEVGYSLAKWIDVGIVGNLIFNSYRFNSGGYRYSQSAFNYGIGAFTRIFPANGFFIQAQPEHNWIKVTQKNLDQTSLPKYSITVDANCFLVGIGYGQRFVGESSFFTTIMFDVNKEQYSPYRDTYGTALPIIRSGINIYLGRKKK